MHLKYNYPTSGNNGQIGSQQDIVSGETITYAYDSLKRLSSASSNQGWGQSFGYDGFGNLTSKSALSGTPPIGTYSVDPATNRLSISSGNVYDANGNQTQYVGTFNALTYDVSNRMMSSSSVSLRGFYEYDPTNQRVYQQKQHFNGSVWVTDATEYYFYGITGQKLGTYWATVSGFGGSASISWTLQSTQVFFRARLIQKNGSNSQMDGRGSVGTYYPYGEERSSPTPNDTVKFATYTRDAVSMFDYAHQRYYASSGGRFLIPDPWSGSAKIAEPSSWNKFSYVGGDPINKNDPWGMDDEAKFCDVYPAYPACAPFFSTGPGPAGTQPTGSQGESPFSIGLTATAGFATAILRLTGDCVKALGAPSERAAQEDIYRLAFNVQYQDLGFTSSVTTASNGAVTFDYAPFKVGQVDGGVLIWNSNSALATPSAAYLGQSGSGDNYYADLVGAFGKQFNLNGAYMLNSYISTPLFQAIYLLHELGHYYNAFGDDSRDPGLSLKNTQTVIDSCFKDLKY